jgi:thioredoxin 1
MLQSANEDTFKQEVLDSELPVLVDFWAEWCQPCKGMVPVLESIAAKYQGRVRVIKVDIDANPELGMQYGVRSLPTLILFEKGKVKVRSGAVPASGVEALLA